VGNWARDLDSAYAHDRLAGKTLAEAEAIFAGPPLLACEDLDSMDAIPFQYYVHAMENLLLSEASRAQPDGASCFLRLIDRKLKSEPDVILAALPKLLDSVIAIAERQVFFEAPPEIYGEFRGISDSIVAEYKRQIETDA
jgi:hypothetical protein